jgi:hypothetical protein
VCIANWNCSDLLRNCLRSLYDQPQGVRLETVVVDNASADDSTDLVAREFPQVRLVRNRENLGFARASNQAAAVARGRYVLFLNNDTVVPPFALRRLLEYAEANPDVGMVGPLLRGGGGSPQISYRRRPTLPALLHRVTLLRWTRLFRRAYYDYRRETYEADAVRPVEVLMGAAVLLRRDVFEACGRWDEDYRFGGEDLDLSTRVGRRHPLMYVGDVEITHFGRASSRQNAGFVAPNVAIGYVHYFRKAGVRPAALAAYKVLVTLDAPVQLAEKLVQGAWRLATGRRAKAAKSWLAARGVWAFVRNEMVRFWRA